MKKIKLFICSLVSVLAMTSLSLQAAELTVKVEGMVCTSCSNKIKEKFSSQDGVTSVESDWNSKTFKVVAANDLSDKTITSLVNDLGYQVVEINRKK